MNSTGSIQDSVTGGGFSLRLNFSGKFLFGERVSVEVVCDDETVLTQIWGDWGLRSVMITTRSVGSATVSV